MKEPLLVKRLTFDPAAVGAALHLSPSEVTELFHNGRWVGWLAKPWSERLFGFRRLHAANAPTAGDALDDGLQHAIAVRALVKEICFQPSGDQGKGRSSSKQNLIDALEKVETFIVADVRGWPTVDFYPLDTKVLLRSVHARVLTTSGLSGKRFDEWVFQRFNVRFVDDPAGRAA